MASLAELREELNQKRKELHEVYAEAGPDLDLSKVTIIHGDSARKASVMQQMMAEINDLGQEHDRLAVLEEQGKRNALEMARLTEPATKASFPTAGAASGVKPWTAGRLRDALTEHKGLKDLRTGAVQTAQISLPDLDVKTLVTLSGVSPQADRQTMQEMGVEERTVADLMLQGTTTSNTVDYYEETTLTNNAAETAEGSEYPESAEAWTLRTATVRDIGHFIPATRDALDDVDWLMSALRGRLAYGVRAREETQILTGDGTGVTLTGFLNVSGIQTQAKGADTTPDAIYKAMQLVRGSAGYGFAEPTGLIIHPADWTDIRLLRTADGMYIWGHPSEPGPDRIWGMPVRQTSRITQNTGLVGAFRPHSELFRRAGLTVTVSTEHSDYFTKRKVAIMAEERITIAVYRPKAFATVTGI